MNLATLPNELIAYIAGHMSYADVRCLMKTNKRIYNALKYYGKDRIRPNLLRFSMKGNEMECVTSGDSNVFYDPVEQYILDNERLGTNIADNIAHVPSQCSFVAEMDFYMMPVTSDVLKMLNSSTKKIGLISIISLPIESGNEEFVTFCQKYGLCITTHALFPDSFWTDDVFVRIVPHVVIDQFPCDIKHHDSRMELTDRTLVKVFEHSIGFEIPGIMTSFTIQGIVKGIQIYSKFGEREFLFQFGVLDSNQLDAADYYFNKDSGELKDRYRISVLDYDDDDARQRNYKLEFKDVEYQSRVYFSVLKPFR